MVVGATAPGVNFADRNELHAHYKTDWRKYNLKRKVTQKLLLHSPLASAERQRTLPKPDQHKDTLMPNLHVDAKSTC